MFSLAFWDRGNRIRPIFSEESFSLRASSTTGLVAGRAIFSAAEEPDKVTTRGVVYQKQGVVLGNFTGSNGSNGYSAMSLRFIEEE